MPSLGTRVVRAPAISLAEFAKALLKIWRPPPMIRPGHLDNLNSPNTAYRIGLGISGGPDSMALAFLFSELNRVKHEFEIPKLDLRALVVDHNARDRSTEEVEKVCEWLHQLGISTSVLTMQWPEGTVPSRLSNFETQARNKRHELWHHACLDQRILSLFFGHHQDDRVETILQRITRNPVVGTLGMSGMIGKGSLEQPILNTNGILYDGPLQLEDFVTSFPNLLEPSQRHHGGPREKYNDLDGQIAVSQWRGDIYRPFLPFRKANLVSTCRSNNVPFITDPTNVDRTFTQRNAIRHILSNYTLPKALQHDSLLTIGKKSVAFMATLNTKIDDLFSETRIIFFDLRSSILQVRFPSPSLTVWSSVDLRTASLYLRQILCFIRPTISTTVSLQHLIPVVQNLFPHLKSPRDSRPGLRNSRSAQSALPQDVSFTLAGVLVTPVRHSHCTSSNFHSSSAAATPSHTDRHSYDYTYTLTRRPMSDRTFHRLSQPLPAALFEGVSLIHSKSMIQDTSPNLISSSMSILPSSSSSYPSSSFHCSSLVFFEDRYIFGLPFPPSSPQSSPIDRHSATTKPDPTSASAPQPRDSATYTLRPLRPRDIATLPQSWKTMLHEAAPGKVRFTLPTVVRSEIAELDLDRSETRLDQQQQQQWQLEKEQKGEQRKPSHECVLGLPTMGLWRDGHGKGWRVVYGKFDTNLLKKVKWGEEPSSASPSSH